MVVLPNLRQVVDCPDSRCRGFGMERHEPRYDYKPAKTVMDCGGKVCRDAAFGPPKTSGLSDHSKQPMSPNQKPRLFTQPHLSAHMAIVKKKWILFIALLLLLIARLAIHLLRPKEPSYQGKTLTQWLQKYEADRTVSGQAVYERAINAIGTNGIPTLLKLLTADHFPGSDGLQSAVEDLGWTNFHAFDASYNCRLADLGSNLGSDGKIRHAQADRAFPHQPLATYQIICALVFDRDEIR